MGRLHLLAATTLCLLALGSTSPAAMAAPRPHVSWQLPAATAGSPTSVSWSASHVPPGSQLVVQRPVGTAKVWRDVVRLTGTSGTSGTASLPPEPLGSYQFRLAVLGSHHRVLAQSQGILHVFGKVPFSVLFGREKQTYATPTASFAYVFESEASNGLVNVTHNPCESVVVEFVPGGAERDSGRNLEYYREETGVLSVVQATHDPVSASAPFNGLNSVSTNLVPGQSWSINLAQQDGEYQDGDDLVFYVNGYAVCDSAAPLNE